MIARTGSLSVCCLTDRDPALVATMLGLVRDVAAEIVVAVDSRVPPAGLGPLRQVADVLLRFEYSDAPERSRPWLVQQCSGTAVLMLDGDEVPSAALVASLPELTRDTEVVQCRIARRWCFPDVEHWLAERPWWPDYQRRLVQVGPALDFDLRVHGGVRDALPARYVDEPIYHLTCVTDGLAARRVRARGYEAARPGLVAVGGGPLSDTLYVPEHFATLPLADTPPEDLELLQTVLAGSDEGPTPALGDLPVVSAAEIAASGPADPLAEQGYRAELSIIEIDRRTEPGNDTRMVVEVRNQGDVDLPRGDARGVQLRVATRVLDPRSRRPVSGWAMTELPCDVPARQKRHLEVLVRVPTTAGSYRLEVDLINERQRWFGCPAEADLVVAGRWDRFARQPDEVR